MSSDPYRRPRGPGAQGSGSGSNTSSGPVLTRAFYPGGPQVLVDSAGNPIAAAQTRSGYGTGSYPAHSQPSSGQGSGPFPPGSPSQIRPGTSGRRSSASNPYPNDAQYTGSHLTEEPSGHPAGVPSSVLNPKRNRAPNGSGQQSSGNVDPQGEHWATDGRITHPRGGGQGYYNTAAVTARQGARLGGASEKDIRDLEKRFARKAPNQGYD